MKRSSMWLIVVCVLAILFFCLPHLALAQPDLPDDPAIDPDTPIPIDGGIAILIAAGVGYGLKKMRDNKKKDRKL